VSLGLKNKFPVFGFYIDFDQTLVIVNIYIMVQYENECLVVLFLLFAEAICIQIFNDSSCE